MAKKVTLGTLQKMKKAGEPISMLTAYDYPTALLVDQAGVEMILVGDSMGMVVHGFPNTLSVTLDMMIMHCQAVMRGVESAFVVGDMPFMTFQVSPEEALRNAGRLMVEGGVDAVKLEGGRRMAETIQRIVEAGIAVQAHIGLTPQSVSALGGFRTQGKTLEAAQQVIDDARAVQDAGAFSVVLEAIPAQLAGLITGMLDIPTIGIGAGVDCDGQVLVMHDMSGLLEKYAPSFVKRFADTAGVLRDAFSEYRTEVRGRSFPGTEHVTRLPEDVWRAIEDEFGSGADT